jgi:hypothetical protein
MELYWQSLLRDIPLTDFDNVTTNRDILAAIEEIKLSAFNGPRTGGRVTPKRCSRRSISTARIKPEHRQVRHAVRHVGGSLRLAVPPTSTLPQPVHSSSHPHRHEGERDEWLAAQMVRGPQPNSLQTWRAYVLACLSVSCSALRLRGWELLAAAAITDANSAASRGPVRQPEPALGTRGSFRLA